MSCAQQVSADPKQVLYGTVDRQEALSMAGRLEPSHLGLALPRGLMRDLRSVVLVLLRAVHDERHHRAVRCCIAAQLVRDEPARRAALIFQQFPKEPGGSPSVAAGLDEDVDHITVLVNRPPEIVTSALNLHKQLVEIPGVAQASSPSPQRARVFWTKGPTPLPNRFVGHRDPSLREEILRIAEAQAEPVSRPGELHPQPLVERYVNLSTHTAPIGQTRRSSRCGMPKGRVFIRISSWTVQLDTDQTTRRRPFAPSPLQRLHHYYERLRPSASHRYSGSCGVTT